MSLSEKARASVNYHFNEKNCVIIVTDFDGTSSRFHIGDTSQIPTDVILSSSKYIFTSGLEAPSFLREASNYKDLFRYIRKSKPINFNDKVLCKEWILELFKWTLTTKEFSKSLEQRCEKLWKGFSKILRAWKKVGFIPPSTPIPTTPRKLERYRERKLVSSRDIVGNSNKTLLTIDFTLKESEYFREIEKQLSYKHDNLLTVLKFGFKEFEDLFELGKQIIGDISDTEYQQIKMDLVRGVKTSGIGKHLSHTKKTTLPFILRYIGEDFHYLWCKEAKSNLTEWGLKTEDINALFKKYKSVTFLNVSSLSDLIRLLLGNSTKRFNNILAALIQFEVPKLTSTSITSLDLIDAKGVSNFELNENGEVVVKGEKKRAHEIKVNELSSGLYRKIDFYLKCTRPYRHLAGELCKKLFLVCNMDSVYYQNSKMRNVIKYLTGCEQLSLINDFPRLVNFGFKSGDITLDKIRRSAGLIAYFKNMSVEEMSQVLGNSQNVVLEHYIPIAVYEAYRVYLIRRFQNITIITATLGEDYCLDCTDFTDISSIFRLLESVMAKANLSSPIVEKLKKQLFPKSEDCPKHDSLLISLSSATIASLKLIKHLGKSQNLESVSCQGNYNLSVEEASLLSEYLDLYIQEKGDESLISIQNEGINQFQSLVSGM